MKRLNNKGLSMIELLVCFVIVAVIAITLLNTIMEYKSDEMTESVRSHILVYKNAITRVIQSDIINNKLVSYSSVNKNCKIVEDKVIGVNTCQEMSTGETTSSETGEMKIITLTFSRPFGNTSTSMKEKNLVIVKSDKLNYIVYPDVVNDQENIILQDVRYTLDPFSKVLDVDTKYAASGSSRKKEYNDVRFLTTGLVENTNNIFSLNIPIYYSEFGTKYSINIVAPFATIH